MYSGLAGVGFNKRYVARLEKLILHRMCVELRYAAGAPGTDEVPISPDELEIVWCMHSGIFYYGIRKFIYRIKVHQDPSQVIALAVDEALEVTPSMLRCLRRGGASGST